MVNGLATVKIEARLVHHRRILVHPYMSLTCPVFHDAIVAGRSRKCQDEFFVPLPRLRWQPRISTDRLSFVSLGRSVRIRVPAPWQRYTHNMRATVEDKTSTVGQD